jgi:pilus assembly protein CpaC
MTSQILSFCKSRMALGRIASLSASAAAVLASVLMAAPMLGQAAHATDMTTSANGDYGHHVRIGLGKSVVIHLPGDARDVIVGNTAIVDAVIRNKNTAYLFAHTTGQTNIFFLDANGQQIMALDLEVAQDTLALTKLLQRALPGNHLTVDVINNSLVMGGTALNADEAKKAMDLATQFEVGNGGDASKVVDTIKIAGEDQVMLQVKVVEMQRDVLKQWGINFSALINAGSFAFNLSNVNPFTNSLLSPNGGYGAAFSSGGTKLSGVLTAMESDGMLHTLAEPNLTAMSGQAASFKAGGQFPYQTCQISSTGSTCQVAFKDYGVQLDFTPTVLTAGRINLQIHTVVSELASVTSGSQSVPSLTNREAKTVLELPDGGSMMLAGLIRETTRQNINGTPGLKQLPVLGALFRSRDFVSNQTELVVIVTPHIVRSVAQKQLESPDANYNIATDRQTILMGRLNKVYGSPAKAPAGNYQGNVGYIVE